MPAPIYLSLVFHNHQPVGQFDNVSEHSAQVSYIPIVDLLERHPAVLAGLHFTGPLLEWLIEHHPELIARLRALVLRGQVEILTGGYYEPVLVALPDKDKVGQIEKLSRSVMEHFGQEPAGLWLAERVWEPHLAAPIAQAGVKYVIVDDTHFEGVGLDKDKDTFGYYMTEEQGQAVAVFPTLTFLRYTIPWSPVEKLIDWLKAEAAKPSALPAPKLALMGDDGEKFGSWPGTYEHCWGDGKYMEKLFTAIEQQGDWLKTITPGHFLNSFPPLGRIYLPTASYMEMGEWSLPADASHTLTALKNDLESQKRTDILRFLRGGIWRSFMVKYDEINHMHKRALWVSDKVHKMRHGRKREAALDLLWAAQSNDPYWHGVFGGIYLFNFRVANYANLIAAEALAEGESVPLMMETRDFDADGRLEILLSGDQLNAIWTPATGGALIELDYRPGGYNFLNIMSRRKEAYHADLIDAARKNQVITPDSPASPELENATLKPIRAKEKGLEKFLIYDWHRRASFVDHFLAPNTTLDEFYRAQYAEQGDFVNLPYQTETAATDEDVNVHMQRDGHVWVGSLHAGIRITKTYSLRRGEPELRVLYTLTSTAGTPIDLRFGVETVIGFDGGQDLRYAALRVDSDPVRRSLNEITASDNIRDYQVDSNLHTLTLSTHLSLPASVWHFPLETITISEAGFERGYQGTVFLHLWPVHLETGASWSVTMVQSVIPEASRP